MLLLIGECNKECEQCAGNENNSGGDLYISEADDGGGNAAGEKACGA